MDRRGLFFGGLPYGDYASSQYVLMNPQDELDQTPFPDWCRANGTTDRMFSRQHFGAFLKETLQEAIAGSRHHVDLISREAVELRRSADGGYSIACADDVTLTAGTVLLAPGSATTRALPQMVGVSGYVDDMYLSTWEEIEARMLACLDAAPHGDNDILVLGSNAAASEVVHCVSRSVALRARIGQMIAVSRHGRFPDGGYSGMVPYVPVFLGDVGLTTAAALMGALGADIERARAAGYSTMDAVLAARPEFGARFSALALDEKHDFANHHAEAYKLATRRTPEVYDRSVHTMAAEGRLRVVAADVDLGRVRFAAPNFEIPTAQGALRGRVLVNCLGAAPIGQSEDRFLQSLAGRYGVNASGHGFCVNPDFEMDENLYLLGPLLAGFTRPEHSIWHLESIPRIVAYAGGLADRVAGRMSQSGRKIFNGGNEFDTGNGRAGSGLQT